MKKLEFNITMTDILRVILYLVVIGSLWGGMQVKLAHVEAAVAAIPQDRAVLQQTMKELSQEVIKLRLEMVELRTELKDMKEVGSDSRRGNH